MRAFLSILGVIFVVGTIAPAQLPPAAGCGLPRLDGKLQAPRVFIYEDGWTIPGLAGANLVGTKFDETGSEVIYHKPTKRAELALQGFQISTDGHSLTFVPGYVQAVSDIIEYRILGRTYAYDVVSASLRRAEPPMWQQVQKVASKRLEMRHGPGLGAGGVIGCGFTILRYFDADGDGRFESLEYIGGFGAPYTNASSCPTTPEWGTQIVAEQNGCGKLRKGTFATRPQDQGNDKVPTGLSADIASATA